MRKLSVLIELAASNWFQRRQRIGSSHNFLRPSLFGGRYCFGGVAKFVAICLEILPLIAGSPVDWFEREQALIRN
jgi:hypothetical protein